MTKAPQVIDNEGIEEPVTLDDVKAFSNIDADYAVNDADLTLMITTARVRLEAFTNVGFAKREVTVIWPGYKIELPLSPTASITSVRKNADVDVMDADEWVADIYPAKTLYIKALAGVGGNWWYSRLNGTAEFTPDFSEPGDAYTVKYLTGHETLPFALKQALLAEVDALFKLKGSAPTELISPNAAMIAQPYSRNLVM